MPRGAIWLVHHDRALIDALTNQGEAWLRAGNRPSELTDRSFEALRKRNSRLTAAQRAAAMAYTPAAPSNAHIPASTAPPGPASALITAPGPVHAPDPAPASNSLPPVFAAANTGIAAALPQAQTTQPENTKSVEEDGPVQRQRCRRQLAAQSASFVNNEEDSEEADQAPGKIRRGVRNVRELLDQPRETVVHRHYPEGLANLETIAQNGFASDLRSMGLPTETRDDLGQRHHLRAPSATSAAGNHLVTPSLSAANRDHGWTEQPIYADGSGDVRAHNRGWQESRFDRAKRHLREFPSREE